MSTAATTHADQTRTTAAQRSGYAPVNGLEMYYEVHGAPHAVDPPLVLLHGGGDTIETSFGQLLPVLAQHRQVIAFEQQGFGHTADILDRPFDFAQSADDAAALLAHLQVPRADLIGFSNGGTIALQAAIRHPQLVRRMVVISGFFRRDGADPAFWRGFATAAPEQMPKELRDSYMAVAPHPENFERFFLKCIERMQHFKDIPDDVMRSIDAPVLVVVADRDVMRPEHAVDTFRLLPHAQLAVLPGTAHMEVTARTEWLAPMIERFLDAEFPTARQF